MNDIKQQIEDLERQILVEKSEIITKITEEEIWKYYTELLIQELENTLKQK